MSSSSSLDSANNLITLAELQRYLDLTTSDGYDPALEYIINAVSQYFNTRTGRKLKSRTLTEYYDGDGGDVLFLKQSPVTDSTSTIEVYKDTATPRAYGADTKVSANSILIYEDEGMIGLVDDVFDAGRQTIKVKYTGGFTTIPADLHRACLEMSASIWKKEKDKVVDLTSISVQGASVSMTMDQATSKFVESVLERYERKSF